MELFILSTDVQNRGRLEFLSPLLNHHPLVNHWTIDLEDIDKVLRIEASSDAKEIEFIRLLRASGIMCARLPE